MVGGAVFPQGGGAAQKASLPASMQVSEPKEHLSVPSAAAARQPAGRVGNGGSAPCRSLNVMYDLECHRGYLALSASRTNSSPLGRHVRAGKEVGREGSRVQRPGRALSASDGLLWRCSSFVYGGHRADLILFSATQTSV